LRASFITIAIDSGASGKAAQDIVGHSTVELTMNVYAKATDRSKRDAIGRLPFATVSAPEHIVRMPESGASTAQEKQGRLSEAS
jgi:hypothetical protein